MEVIEEVIKNIKLSIRRKQKILIILILVLVIDVIIFALVGKVGTLQQNNLVCGYAFFAGAFLFYGVLFLSFAIGCAKDDIEIIRRYGTMGIRAIEDVDLGVWS